VSRARLQQYLANIAGIDPARAAVIEGFRRIPAIPSEYADRNAPLPPLPALRDTAPEAQYTALASHAATRRLRHALITEGPQQFNWLRVLQLALTFCSLWSNSLLHVTSPFLL
jgi:hypothetical protein